MSQLFNRRHSNVQLLFSVLLFLNLIFITVSITPGKPTDNPVILDGKKTDGKLSGSRLLDMNYQKSPFSAGNFNNYKSKTIFDALIFTPVFFEKRNNNTGFSVSAPNSFTNSASIAIPGSESEVIGAGAASPYSSDINVSGLNGTITDLNVKINNFSHTFPNDVAMLLVAPTGQQFVLQSEVGGKGDVTNIVYTFDDQATAAITTSSFPANDSSVKPSSVGNTGILSSPAPFPNYNQPVPEGWATLKSVFGGLNPNGRWQLFVFDFFAGNSGSIRGGWTLEITTNNPVVSPSVSGISPNNQTTGGTNFELTVNGSNFNANSAVRWNGQNRATTFVSNSQIKAQILASDLQTSGVYPVTVSNSATGGGVSNGANFSVSACSYSITPNSGDFTSSGGNGVAAITTTDGCLWSAVSNASWITINGGNSGTGTGTVSFTVLQNTGDFRNGTITLGGQTFTVNQTAAPSSFDISGTVTYGITPSGQSVQYVPGVNFSVSGTSVLSAASDASGFYRLPGLSAGTYTVTAQKNDELVGINSQDAARIQQYLVGLTNFTENQLAAADVDNNGIVNSVDAARIQQYVVGINTSVVIGHWKILPATRQYNSITGGLTGENYQAVLIGEVSGNWTPAASVPATEYLESAEKSPTAINYEAAAELLLQDADQSNDLQTEIAANRQSNLKMDEQAVNHFALHQNEVAVSLPFNAYAGGGTTVNLPVTVSDLTNANVEGFNFTVFYNSDVLVPVAGDSAIEGGTLSEGCSVIGNSPAAGQLKVSGSCTFPINAGSGTIINLRFNVIGTGGQQTPLSFNNPNVSGSVNTFQINSGTPQVNSTNGLFTVTGPTAAPVSISGRVMTSSGRGIRNALVTSVDSYGKVRIARTRSFGYYSFDEVVAGSTYIISVTSKSYQFAQPTQVVSVNENLAFIDFIAAQRQIQK